MRTHRPAGDQPARISRPSRPSRPTARRVALLAPAALLATALAVPGSAFADAGPADHGTSDGTVTTGVAAEPAAAAAAWASAQLTDGSHASGDHGMTADLVLALASTGTDGAATERAVDWLAANAGDYIHRRGEDTVFAGGTAKVALAASAAGHDPTDFGGRDLIDILDDTLQDNGRFSDLPTSADASNQFGQSLGVLAMARTGDVPEEAVRFLVDTQCPDGGFPLSLAQNPDSCTSDPDSTGMAVQALLAVDRPQEVADGLDYLVDAQLDNGGFFQHPVFAGDANSNSTGLAVQALTAGGRDDAAARGLEFLHSMQLGCDAPADERGAVGYTEPVANGLALRATAQAIPALAGQPLGDIDGRGADPDPYVIECDPDDGGGDGGDGGNGGSGGDDGGGDGGPGGDDGSGGDNGGDGGGGDDSGGADDTTGGLDGGDGIAGGGTADGGADGAGADGGVAGQPGNDPSPDGGLASTGTSALPVAAAALGLLAVGGLLYALALRRRRTNTA